MTRMTTVAQELLEARRTALTRQVATERALEAEERAAAEDRTDRAHARADGELFARLSERERLELSEIDAALERIRQGIYGTCESCHHAIGRARLSALPSTRLCLGCSASRKSA